MGHNRLDAALNPQGLAQAWTGAVMERTGRTPVQLAAGIRQRPTAAPAAPSPGRR